MENLRKILRAGARYARLPLRLGAYAGPIERLLLLSYEEPSKPQLFILGLPRSGTTLVYQYIVHRLMVSYFTNGVGSLREAPCLATFFQRKIYGDYSSDFVSRYGKVKGPVAPREAGAFWGRFFSRDDYVEYEGLSKRHVRTLRRTIACVERIFGGAPFVNKNVKHLLRIGALRRIYPESHFLIVERDRTDVALSLLRGRYETLVSHRQWLSARPPDYEYLRDLPVTEQVAGQLVSLTDRMERDLAEVPGRRLLKISYDSFCRDPESLIRQIREKMGPIGDRNGPVESFTVSRNIPESLDEKELVRKIESG